MEKMRKQFIVAIMALLFLAVLMVTAVMSVPAKEHSDFRFTGNVTQLWDEPHAGANWTNAFSVRDLNGDDKADVLVLTSSYNEATSTETATVIAKRGSDGKHIWTELVSGTVPTLIVSAGDLGEDETGDVLVMMTTSELDMTTFTTNTAARLIAKRGCDGKRIWTTESDGPIWVGSAWADLNGDEIADVLLGSRDQVYALGYREE